MALPITVPYTFGNATTAIPLSNLDSDYATVYQAVNGIGNGSVALANVTITGGTVSNVSGVVPTPFTANGVVYASTTSALATGSALQFNGTILGLGSTPSVWFNDYRTIQLAGSASLSGRTSQTGWVQLMSNVFRDSSANYLYNGTGPASDYRMVDNACYWYQAPSGTAGNPITFNQAMTLDSSGSLLVGGTSQADVNANGGFYVSPNSRNTYTVTSHLSGASSGSYYAYFFYANSNIGSITQNGTTGVLYNLTSDYRLKNNQEVLTGAKDFVMALKPKKWQWWDGSGEGVGFVAHEFMEVAKYSGHGEKDAVETVEIKDEEGNVTGTEQRPIYQAIQPSSSEVMANLVAFIQELSAKVTALEAKLGV